MRRLVALALFMALAPISVAVNRTNTMDTFLVLTLMLAAWALLRACETGRTRTLLGAMALVGVGFNVKMLAAFVVLPAFALTWLIREVPLRTTLRGDEPPGADVHGPRVAEPEAVQ